MRRFIEISQFMIAVPLLLGCAHSVGPQDLLQEKISLTQTPDSMLWHDRSTGGLYGIGDGWSIEIQVPKFETVRDVVAMGPAKSELVVVPAEYEWLKSDGEDLDSGPVMEKQPFIIPMKYIMVTETVVDVPARTGYYVTDASYDPVGNVQTPRAVKLRTIPATLKQVERLVVTVPTHAGERLVPVERREGYKRVPIRPARVQERALPSTPKVRIREKMKVPYKFTIKNPDGEIAHVFDAFEELTAFVDSLK